MPVLVAILRFASTKMSSLRARMTACVSPHQVSSGHCRLELVCEECIDECEVDSTIATVTSDTIPSCKAIPVGVSKVSSTTLETFDLLPGYYRVSADSRVIRECYRTESCTGGDNSLNYCATGYTGPCE